MKKLLNDGVLDVMVDKCEGEKHSRRLYVSTPDGKIEILVRLYEGKKIEVSIGRGKASLHSTLAARLVVEKE